MCHVSTHAKDNNASQKRSVSQSDRYERAWTRMTAMKTANVIWRLHEKEQQKEQKMNLLLIVQSHEEIQMHMR